jgi:hypothetical protein
LLYIILASLVKSPKIDKLGAIYVCKEIIQDTC